MSSFHHSLTCRSVAASTRSCIPKASREVPTAKKKKQPPESIKRVVKKTKYQNMWSWFLTYSLTPAWAPAQGSTQVTNVDCRVASNAEALSLVGANPNFVFQSCFAAVGRSVRGYGSFLLGWDGPTIVQWEFQVWPLTRALITPTRSFPPWKWGRRHQGVNSSSDDLTTQSCKGLSDSASRCSIANPAATLPKNPSLWSLARFGRSISDTFWFFFCAWQSQTTPINVQCRCMCLCLRHGKAVSCNVLETT